MTLASELELVNENIVDGKWVVTFNSFTNSVMSLFHAADGVWYAQGACGVKDVDTAKLLLPSMRRSVLAVAEGSNAASV